MFSNSKEVNIPLLAATATLIIFLNHIHLQDVEAIVSGINAKSGQWPFFAWLDYRLETCGAVIVDEQHVVTLASCIGGRNHRLKSITVRVGSEQRTIKDNPNKFKVERACIPTNYGWNKNGLIEDNYALLRLTKPMTFDNRTSKANFDDKHTWNSTKWSKCYVVGAGYEIKKRWASTLKYSQIDMHHCLGKTHPATFCFHHQGPIAGTSCRGDSGGPVVCEADKKFWLIGLVHRVAAECRPYAASTGLVEAISMKRFLNTTFHDCIKWLNFK